MPAFETQQYKMSNLPESKAEVVKRLDLGTLLTFRYYNWSQGHHSRHGRRDQDSLVGSDLA